jgi:hypothetical protein
MNVTDIQGGEIDGGRKKCPKGSVRDRRKGRRSHCRSKSTMRHKSKGHCPKGEIKDHRKGAPKGSCRKARAHKTFNSKGKVVKVSYRLVSKGRRRSG